MTDWWRSGADGSLSLSVHVQPGAKRSEFAGLHGDALKIRLAAPPVDGKANAALLALIADRLGVPKGRVCLKSGQTSRNKVVLVVAAPTDWRSRLLASATA